MTVETTWQHSWPWPLWIAVLGGGLLAAGIIWLYRHELRVRGTPATWWVMLLLRLVALLLVVWMLFGWLRQRHRSEPADLIVALDDSASMAFDRDEWDAVSRAELQRLAGADRRPMLSRFDIARRLLTDERRGWLQSLGPDYHLQVVLLADSARPLHEGSLPRWDDLSADRPASRLGAGVGTILDAQRGRPTAAIVLLTDGITTEGPSLADVAGKARQMAVPLFVVGVGSDKPVRDVWLSNLLADEVVFVDDQVVITCHVQATGLAGRKSKLRLLRTDTRETLAENDVVMPADGERLPVRLSFQAQSQGAYPLAVRAEPLEGEADRTNNELSHQLRVEDSTIRVLLVQASPSFEFRYLRDLLGRATKRSPAQAGSTPPPQGSGNEAGASGNSLSLADTGPEKAFTLTTVLQEADPEWIADEGTAAAVFPLQREELFPYDAVILGDADPAFLGTSAAEHLVEFVQERGGGVLFIAGPRFMPLAFRSSPLAKLFPFDSSSPSLPLETPLTNPFSAKLTPVGQMAPPCLLVPGPEDNVRLWSRLPGLYWHVDVPDPNPAARVLLEHPTRSDARGRRLPLVLMQYFGAGRVIFHTTDETYRWARHEGNDEFYARYWLQTIRFLSRSKLLSDGSPVELTVERQQFTYGEGVPIRVRFRQAGAAPHSADGVTVLLQREQGRRQTLVLQPDASQSGVVFAGTASGLVPGDYQVSLGTPVQPPPPPRSFHVAPLAQEQSLRPLNRGDLERAARLSRGRYYELRDAARLPAELPRGPRVRIESLPPETIWNSPVVAALFVALLTAEWILRKRAGLL